MAYGVASLVLRVVVFLSILIGMILTCGGIGRRVKVGTDTPTTGDHSIKKWHKGTGGVHVVMYVAVSFMAVALVLSFVLVVHAVMVQTDNMKRPLDVDTVLLIQGIIAMIVAAVVTGVYTDCDYANKANWECYFIGFIVAICFLAVSIICYIVELLWIKQGVCDISPYDDDDGTYY